jgi:predicted Zn-dependent protease with MMP-like domain
MSRPSAQEFLQTLLDAFDDLPPELAPRLAEILNENEADRSQAIRQLFEDVAGESGE